MATIDHIGIYVKELESSISFYQEAFQFSLHSRLVIGETKIAFMNTGNSLIEIIQRQEPLEAPKKHWTHIALTVINYSETLKHLRTLGLEILESTISSGKRIAFLKDPDGHDLEIDEEPFNK